MFKKDTISLYNNENVLNNPYSQPNAVRSFTYDYVSNSVFALGNPHNLYILHDNKITNFDLKSYVEKYIYNLSPDTQILDTDYFSTITCKALSKEIVALSITTTPYNYQSYYFVFYVSFKNNKPILSLAHSDKINAPLNSTYTSFLDSENLLIIADTIFTINLNTFIKSTITRTNDIIDSFKYHSLPFYQNKLAIAHKNSELSIYDIDTPAVTNHSYDLDSFTTDKLDIIDYKRHEKLLISRNDGTKIKCNFFFPPLILVPIPNTTYVACYITKLQCLYNYTTGVSYKLRSKYETTQTIFITPHNQVIFKHKHNIKILHFRKVFQ